MKTASDNYEQLFSDSVHARFGAVQALRSEGASVLPKLASLAKNRTQPWYSRLAALEVIRKIADDSDEEVVAALRRCLEDETACIVIDTIHAIGDLRIESLLPAVRALLEDKRCDERVQWFPEEEDWVGAVARKTIDTFRLSQQTQNKRMESNG